MIERLLGHLIVRKEIEGFVPTKEVPISILNFKPKYQKPEDDNSNGDKPRRNDKPRSNSPSTDKPKAKKPRNRKPITDRDTGIPRGTRKPKSV